MPNNIAQSPNEERRSAFGVMEKNELPGHLYFWTRDDWKEKIPEDQNELRLAFDNTCSVLRARFQHTNAEKFRAEFVRLLSLAHATFSTNIAHVAEGRKSLDAYRTELIRQEGPAIKNEHLKELAISAFVGSIAILIFAALIRIGIFLGEKYQLVSTEHGGSETALVVLSSIKWDIRFSPMHFGFLLASTMWGIWLSFAVRNMDFQFEQLQHPEADMMRPWSRLLVFGLLAFILALFFQMGVLVISVGGVSTNQISDNVLVAIFVGLCLGFTDKVLPREVRRRIEEFFQSARTGS